MAANIGIESGIDIQDPWRKEGRSLWQHHEHPDNFTDSSFLEALVVHAVTTSRSYRQVVFASKVVAQQMGTVACVIAVSLHLREGILDVRSLLAWNVALILAFVATYIGTILAGRRGIEVPTAACSGHIAANDRSSSWQTWRTAVGVLSVVQTRRAARRVTLLVVGTFLLSPLLQTLTRTISSDTIAATTVYATIAHLALHDYNFVASVTDKLTGSLSLAAAIFSSVLLASRLATALQVFSQILFSMQAYLLLPYLQRSLAAASPAASAVTALAITAGGALLILPLSAAAVAAYCAAVAFVSLACPYWLVRIHKFKAHITGPWDEAAPQLPMAVDTRTH